jgi:hypothetical protein
LKTNNSLTQEEVDVILKTNPNAIIPHKATVVPKGAFIYEIAHPKEHFNEKGEYIPHYPGLITDSHPDGYEIPCCRRRPPKDTPAPKTEVNANINTYIVDANKYPIQHNRWGFLPLPAQLFFQMDNNKCVSKSNTAVIKHNKPCLLRYGVEHSVLQSFVACFADIYASDNNLKKTPTIEEMRNIILNAISLDTFLDYHNSSLSSIFRPNVAYKVNDLSKYDDSDFVQYVDTNSNYETQMRDSLIGSYENFRSSLSQEGMYIDHVFMWDIVTQPNPKLLKKGVNMAILQITKDSDYIDLLCPPSAYSQTLYDPKKGTILLLKQDVFYEPVYLYENKDGSPHDIKIFYKNKSDPGMQTILTRIENLTTKYCKPKNSIPQHYKYQRALSQIDTLDILHEYGYIVKEQVINYQFRTIGLYATFGKDSVFIPCSSSHVIHGLTMSFFDDDQIWSDYIVTKSLLEQVYKKTEGKIKCLPIRKVVDKSLVIGFITETNQFVKLSTPVDVYKHADSIEIVRGIDYFSADRAVTLNAKPDDDRITITRNVNLESQFYNVFRSTIRILLSYYENRKVKADINQLLLSKAYKYNQKLKRIEKLLRDMSTSDVVFEDMDISNITDVTSCLTNCATKPHCLSKTDGKCALKIPLHNLLTKRDNGIVYYGKLADELVRFQRIRSFIMEPKNYLNLSNVNYKINNDEILLLDSTLNSDYLNDMNVFDVNDYIQNISYDTAEPELVTQHYSNSENLLFSEPLPKSDTEPSSDK